MKIVKARESKKFEDGKTFAACEYDTQDPDLNTARIEIKGRYPLNGTMRNTRVKEIVYVESGEGEVAINGVRKPVEQGDVIFFKSGDLIFWNGNFTLITTCTPAWSPDQHEFIS